METTLEEARRCPSCQEPGIKINTRRAPNHFPPGTQIDMMECRNDRCPDYMAPQNGPFSTMPAIRSRWAIQINPDGTVPPKNTLMSQPKEYALPSENSEAAQRARDAMARMAELDVHERGGEAYQIR